MSPGTLFTSESPPRQYPPVNNVPLYMRFQGGLAFLFPKFTAGSREDTAAPPTINTARN